MINLKSFFLCTCYVLIVARDTEGVRMMPIPADIYSVVESLRKTEQGECMSDRINSCGFKERQDQVEGE